MLVIVMTIHLLLRRPAVLVVFASRDRALPRARMGLLVLGKVARTLELLVTAWLATLLRGELLGAGVLLSASHRTHDLLLVFQFLAGRALDLDGPVVLFINDLDRLAGSHGNGLSVLLDANKLGGPAVDVNAAVQLDLISSKIQVSWVRGQIRRGVIRVNVHVGVVFSLFFGVRKLLGVLANLVHKVDEVTAGVWEVARASLLAVAQVFNGSLDASNRRQTEIEIQAGDLGPLL